jgi:SAM-dependent methyltransferase
MHGEAMEEFQKFFDQHLVPLGGGKVLDIGSYDVNGTYAGWFIDREIWNYRGCDIEAGPNVDIVLPSLYDWKDVLPDNEADVVISGQVLEHVPKPWRWFPELVRILKPGGLLYVAAPNTWEYHPYPVDCWRVWPDGLRALFDEFGIDPLNAYFRGNDTIGIGIKQR